MCYVDIAQRQSVLASKNLGELADDRILEGAAVHVANRWEGNAQDRDLM